MSSCAGMLDEQITREKTWVCNYKEKVDFGGHKMDCKNTLVGLYVANMHDPANLAVSEFYQTKPAGNPAEGGCAQIAREKTWNGTLQSSIAGTKVACESTLSGLYFAKMNDPSKMQITEYWIDKPLTAGNPAAAGGAQKSAKGTAVRGTGRGASKKPAARGPGRGSSKK